MWQHSMFEVNMFHTRRVNIDNPDWIPPTSRNDARYYEDEEGAAPTTGVKKSRFLRKSRHMELSYKDQLPSKEDVVKSKHVVDKQKPEQENIEESGQPKLKTTKNSRGLTVVDFPFDPSDLPPLPQAPPRNKPDYFGWTHSDDADSWYLEAHTPSIHENYENFYDEALKKKVICPKFYSCV